MSEYKRITEKDSYGYWCVRNERKELISAPNRETQKVFDYLAELEDKIESGKMIELPCEMGDTAYLIYSSEQREPIPFVVDFIVTHKLREEERLFVYDSDGYGGRFGDCCKGNYVWYIGTNKTQAQARLKELKGE